MIAQKRGKGKNILSNQNNLPFKSESIVVDPVLGDALCQQGRIIIFLFDFAVVSGWAGPKLQCSDFL